MGDLAGSRENATQCPSHREPKQLSLNGVTPTSKAPPLNRTYFSRLERGPNRGREKTSLCLSYSDGAKLLQIMAYRSKEELEDGITEYLEFCHRERTAARASELATFLDVGYRNLRRLSNRLLGVSVIVALRLRQLEYSAKLLRETKLPIDEIGLRAGFGDRRTFFRAIRREFGCSPSTVRKDGQYLPSTAVRQKPILP